MAVRDPDEFLHVPDGELINFGAEVYAFIKRRMREMDPANAEKPLCYGCVGTVVNNVLMESATENKWSREEMTTLAEDLVERLDEALAPTLGDILAMAGEFAARDDARETLKSAPPSVKPAILTAEKERKAAVFEKLIGPYMAPRAKDPS